jgi:hypothetical protein
MGGELPSVLCFWGNLPGLYSSRIEESSGAYVVFAKSLRATHKKMKKISKLYIFFEIAIEIF